MKILFFCCIIVAVFFQANAFAGERPAAEVTINEVTYKGYVIDGIMYSEANPRAIIAGTIYKLHNTLGDAEITGITPDQVTIKFRDSVESYVSGDVVVLEAVKNAVIGKDSPLHETIRNHMKETPAPAAQETLQEGGRPAAAQRTTLTGDGIDYIDSNGQRVQIDIYNPGYRSCPAVVLIHGASGIDGDRGIRYRGFAMDLKSKGMVAINVHYFDSAEQNWATTFLQAISYAQHIPNVDKNKIGLVGYSLGGTLALYVASCDPRIKALAICAGYMPGGFTKADAARLPKTLMISGSEDSAMDTLNQIQAWFTELGKTMETRIDKGVGHDNIPLGVFQEDWNTIAAFLQKNL